MLSLHDIKRILGAVYTPPFLAAYLAQSVLSVVNKSNANLCVIDPACGDGALLRAFNFELAATNAVVTVDYVGIDKDPTAIKEARSQLPSQNTRLLCRDFVAHKGWHKQPGQRQVILSNPPWGASLVDYSRDDLRRRYEVAKGQFDIFDLFVEGILENCADGDVFGLILPDSIFAHEHELIRRMLLGASTLHLVARLGEKLFSGVNRGCTVFVGEKGSSPNGHLVTCFRLNRLHRDRVLEGSGTLQEAQRALAHQVPQRRFSENNNSTIDLDLDIKERAFSRMSRFNSRFADFVTTHRGVELSKKGKVGECPNCGLWMPFPTNPVPRCPHCKLEVDLEKANVSHIVLDHNGRGNLPFKVGEDLFRYTSQSRRWIDTTKTGINYKPLELYMGPKILVRKTGIGITASLDYTNSLTNQVVYILRLRPLASKYLTLEFVLAVLNSRAMTYYLLKKYGENEWRSHPYLTQSILESLPFPASDDSSPSFVGHVLRVTELVREVATASENDKIDTNVDAMIERSVASCFKLNAYDYCEIRRTLKTAQQMVPIRRLLECNFENIFDSTV